MNADDTSSQGDVSLSEKPLKLVLKVGHQEGGESTPASQTEERTKHKHKKKKKTEGKDVMDEVNTFSYVFFVVSRSV
jgi:hypothetical protein